jgi:predicted nucleic acid-binding protein
MAAGIASPGGASARILRNVLAGHLRLVISHGIEAEYYDGASKKGILALFARHNVRPEFYRLELDALCLIAERVAPTGKAPPCRDEDDRKYLHCAQFANVDYLVTYDRDLLDLDSIGEIPIVTSANLLQRASAAGIELIQ